ncbi:class I tRNA ligase family protein, partial [Patescibacteria group bacterium]|nr:class I tRNA ligase family protein [Patescibacteria group bacterium]
HIAPAFGADDMEAGKKNDLPVILTVDEEGKFKNEVKNWAGVFVKNADKEIIKDLESRNILFKSEKITHTYPFCWRCDSPLLYYPLETWYIAVEKIKDELIQNNKKINWIPSHIKEGRFGKWLEGARDWAFSRNRYWGAPVPIWQCDQCKEIKVAGSLEEIRNELDGVNKIFLVRHGDSENNKKQILNSLPEKEKFHLTESGIGQINYLADKIKNEKIDAIFSSPLLRTKETAEIISKKLGIEIIFDERIRELDLGEMNGRSGDDLAAIHPTRQSRLKKTKMGVESGEHLKTRMENFLDEINKNYKNKNIVIVSHGDPIQMFFGITKGMEIEEIYKDDWYPKRGSLTITYSRPIDLHRPFIDEVVLSCGKCQGKMKRVPEVFDCWFESGAMPYAQYHYPFENKKLVEETFPADFIAEGLDQTRGWFYTLHVLAAALFNNQAFKNVVANGLILDSQGRKLSKKLRNYTEPEEIMEKFGADALRFYLLSSTAIGEDYLFDDKGVQESMRKITANLYNSVNFLKIYSSLEKIGDSKNSSNILDKWILTRLQKAINDVSKNMDQYDLTRASRIFIDLLDDLSNWHIRRSRSRFQHNEDEKDYESAVSVLRYVLIEVSKLIAPFMPFVSEKVYQELKGEKESVHLEEWPEVGLVDTDLLTAMSFVRSFASMALMQRAEHNIKVRQPLQRLSIKHTGKEPLYWNKIKNILADEVNVKEVMLDVTMTQDDPPIKLDVNVTPELKDEGNLRGLIRGIQDLRKKKGFVPSDRIKEIIFTDKKGKNLIELHMKDIKKGTGAVSIEFSPNIGEEIKIDELKFKIEIKK